MEHVVLRPVESEELGRLLQLEWDPAATGEFQWFGFRMDTARELERRWQQDGLIGAAGSYLAVGVDDGGCAGLVSWRPLGPTPNYEIGIALFPEYRGRGLGTEAQRQLVEYLFATTTAHRLQAGTEIDNLAEQHALERVGFQKEGIARGLYFRAGAWRDSVFYAVLRPDIYP
jgi:RimJ/RimL family protein N-acetyltransferase